MKDKFCLNSHSEKRKSVYDNKANSINKDIKTITPIISKNSVYENMANPINHKDIKTIIPIISNFITEV